MKSEVEVQPRLMRVEDAARYLSCSKHAIRAAIWDAELRYVRIGRRHLLDRCDLDALIERRKVRVGEPTG